MALHDLSMLAAPPGACHATQNKSKIEAQTWSTNIQKSKKIKVFSYFSSFLRLTPPKSTKMISRSIPGSGPKRHQEHPRPLRSN